MSRLDSRQPGAASRLQQALVRAVQVGVLPPDATIEPVGPDSHRPWPVVLLTAIGAWFVAAPLVSLLGLLVGDLLRTAVGSCVVGLLVLAVAVAVLRRRDVSVFVEQLAVPGLLVGGVTLGMGLYRTFELRGGSLVLMVVALAVAGLIERPWLRVLLGAAAAGLLMLAVGPTDPWRGGARVLVAQWWAVHVVLLPLGLLGWALQRGERWGGARARWAGAAEALGTGWTVAVLAGLAWLAGMTFLLGGTLGGALMAELARDGAGRAGERSWALVWLLPGLSAAWALAGAVLAARAWPALRRPAVLAAAAVLVALAGLLPSLGGVCLVLAGCVVTQRWRLAGAAALAAAWVIGSFYYQLAWPLATKALWLVAAGALLAGLAWWAQRSVPRAASMPAVAQQHGVASALIVLSLLATLSLVNFSIWQKEDLIAHGQPIFVELAPVDPRSLAQGDYLRLNFRLPGQPSDMGEALGARRPYVIARRDARGVATLLRTQSRPAPLAPGELRIELTPIGGRWSLVTDAWFFTEGQAARWAGARYGEFRVAPDGRALLVGLADADLRPLGAPR